MQRKSYLPSEASNYSGKFPYFRQPVEFGYFSHDTAGQITFDAKSLKVLKMPLNPNRVDFDLSLNFDTFIQKEDSKLLDDLLLWLQRNKMKFRSDDEPTERVPGLNTDFVCWRGVLTKIACTPFENSPAYGSWKIAVTKHRGTHYMCEFDTQSKIEKERRSTRREKEMSYWGFKFEQYMCVDDINDEPNTSAPVNNKENYVSVARSRLNKHSLVFGGEVDCYRTVNNKREYVELKTSREIDNQRQDCNFRRHKLKKWWLQSFLIGVPTIICGFRDDDGVVQRLETFHTRDLPKKAVDLPNSWDAAVCFNFLDHFLQFVKTNVIKENPRTAYVFEWQPGQDVSVQEMNDSHEYCFLPKWYNEQT